MSIETAHAAHETERHEAHEGSYSSASASLGEKLFIWVAWALAAAFIAVTMGLYFPGFLSTSPEAPAPPPPVSAPVEPIG